MISKRYKLFAAVGKEEIEVVYHGDGNQPKVLYSDCAFKSEAELISAIEETPQFSLGGINANFYKSINALSKHIYIKSYLIEE